MNGFQYACNGRRGVLFPMVHCTIFIFLLCSLWLANVSSVLAEITEEQENELAEKYKRGEVDRESLVEMAKDLSFSEKMRLYIMSRELRPYFKPIERAIRNLARTSPDDEPGLSKARRETEEAMKDSFKRLMDSDRPEKEKDWQRGLLGLIFLDKDWRKRNEQAGENEVKNPFDLAELFDEINEHLAGPGKNRENTNCAY